MAHQKAVIATIADGTEIDLIDSGTNGFIIDVDSVQQLTNCIQTLLIDSNNLELIGINAQKSILNKASLTNMVNNYIKAIIFFLNTNS